MPGINPEIMVWARETAGLTRQEAARKLGFRDSSRSTAADKLAAIEYGEKEPSRPQLVKMAGQYHRPLLTFYLSKPPAQGARGADFRAPAGRLLTLGRRVTGCADPGRKGASEHGARCLGR